MATKKNTEFLLVPPLDKDIGLRENRIKIAAAIRITPDSLWGIERRIAYANRKYHSGLMWAGVTIGLAEIKFSPSL